MRFTTFAVTHCTRRPTLLKRIIHHLGFTLSTGYIPYLKVLEIFTRVRLVLPFWVDHHLSFTFPKLLYALLKIGNSFLYHAKTS